MAWYDYPTNFSNGLNVSGYGDMFTYIGYVSNNSIGSLLVFSIMIISFLTLKATGTTSGKAITVSLFGTFLLSVFMIPLDIVSPMTVMGLGVAAIVAGLMARNEANTLGI